MTQTQSNMESYFWQKGKKKAIYSEKTCNTGLIGHCILPLFIYFYEGSLRVCVDCTSRHARWTSLIIQQSPDSTDCFNKRQLSSRVARRTLLSTQTHNACAVRIYIVHYIINEQITNVCVLPSIAAWLITLISLSTSTRL